MIYDDLNICSLDLIEKLREKLSVAKDRSVMLEAEADAQFFHFYEAQESFEILRSKGIDLITAVQHLLLCVDEFKVNLPVELLVEAAKVEAALEEFCFDSDGMPF